MARTDRNQPMPVKYWSSAGILLTYWCNASCASCYVCCGPTRREWIDVSLALRVWRELIDAGEQGCRVHLTGGEPFGDWPRLIELCRRAKDAGLAPLEKIETNAFWAAETSLVEQRLRELDAAGMRRLVISADPYHQQFVPIARCHQLAAAARRVLGAERVRVRWQDWLDLGCDTAHMTDAERSELFAKYAQDGRDRLSGRAAGTIVRHLPPKPLAELADNPCKEALLRSKHVHVGPDGLLWPGTCAGISLGRAGGRSVEWIWKSLQRDHVDRPILGALAAGGPVALLALAREHGFVPAEGYAGKCELCRRIREHLARRGLFGEELAPRWMYDPSCQAPSEAYFA